MRRRVLFVLSAFILVFLLLGGMAEAACLSPGGNTKPNFPNMQGNVFGWLAGQWQSFLGGKVDQTNGCMDNPTINNPTITGGNFGNLPLGGTAAGWNITSIPFVSSIGLWTQDAIFQYNNLTHTLSTEFLNFLISGADPTGISDSAAAINTACIAAQSLGLPLNIVGTFKFSSAETLNCDLWFSPGSKFAPSPTASVWPLMTINGHILSPNNQQIIATPVNAAATRVGVINGTTSMTVSGGTGSVIAGSLVDGPGVIPGTVIASYASSVATLSQAADQIETITVNNTSGGTVTITPTGGSAIPLTIASGGTTTTAAASICSQINPPIGNNVYTANQTAFFSLRISATCSGAVATIEARSPGAAFSVTSGVFTAAASTLSSDYTLEPINAIINQPIVYANWWGADPTGTADSLPAFDAMTAFPRSNVTYTATPGNYVFRTETYSPWQGPGQTLVGKTGWHAYSDPLNPAQYVTFNLDGVTLNYASALVSMNEFVPSWMQHVSFKGVTFGPPPSVASGNPRGMLLWNLTDAKFERIRCAGNWSLNNYTVAGIRAAACFSADGLTNVSFDQISMPQASEVFDIGYLRHVSVAHSTFIGTDPTGTLNSPNQGINVAWDAKTLADYPDEVPNSYTTDVTIDHSVDIENFTVGAFLAGGGPYNIGATFRNNSGVTAQFIGYISNGSGGSGNLLCVSAVAAGEFYIGQTIGGTPTNNVISQTSITAIGTSGCPGGQTGYTVSAAQLVSSTPGEAMLGSQGGGVGLEARNEVGSNEISQYDPLHDVLINASSGFYYNSNTNFPGGGIQVDGTGSNAGEAITGFEVTTTKFVGNVGGSINTIAGPGVAPGTMACPMIGVTEGVTGCGLTVPSNAALAAVPTASIPSGMPLTRLDFASGYGAPSLEYHSETGTCAANSRVNDGGSCTNTTASIGNPSVSDGNSWYAKFTGQVNWRIWGCSPANSASGNTTACENAITWALANNAPLYAPNGVYNLNGQLSVTQTSANANDLMLYGDGPDATILEWANGSTNGGGIKVTRISTGLVSGATHLRDLALVTLGTNSGIAFDYESPTVHNDTDGGSTLDRVKIVGIVGTPWTYWAEDAKYNGVSNVNINDSNFWGDTNGGLSSSHNIGLDLEATQATTTCQDVNCAFIYNLNSDNFFGSLYGIKYGIGIQGVTVTGTNFTLNYNGIYSPPLPTASWTAEIATTTMTVSAISSGQLFTGQLITSGAAAGTMISSVGSCAGPSPTLPCAASVSISQTVSSPTAMTGAGGATQSELALTNDQFDNTGDNVLVDTGGALPQVLAMNNLTFPVVGTFFFHAKGYASYFQFDNNQCATASGAVDSSGCIDIDNSLGMSNIIANTSCAFTENCVVLNSGASGVRVSNTRVDFEGNTSALAVTDNSTNANLITGPNNNSAGAMFFPQAFIVSAAASDSGSIELTLSAPTALLTNNELVFVSLPGLSNQPGLYREQVIDSTHVLLVGSAYSGSLSGNGYIFVVP
jgi:hypothetical protein